MVGLTLEQCDHKRDEKKSGAVPNYARSKKGFILEIIKIIIITLAIVMPVRYFLFQPFYVHGASMEPNFHNYQYLLIDEVTYRFSTPQRGDVVVLKVPFEQEALIKRIIGLPNEIIDIHHGRVTIFNAAKPSGQILDETYLEAGVVTDRDQRVVLGADQYFVLGDNRPVSLDSRYFGPIVRQQIIGRAWLRVWPFKTFQHFATPTYSNLITNTSEQ
jgi:signal peptidase I